MIRIRNFQIVWNKIKKIVFVLPVIVIIISIIAISIIHFQKPIVISNDNNISASAYEYMQELPALPSNSKSTKIVNVLGVEAQKLTFAQKNINMLMYHHIRNFTDTKDPVAVGLSVSPKSFDKQMSELVKLGYTSITFADLINYIQNKSGLPANPVLISFDDGYDNSYTEAYPILKKYNYHGSFAIITGSVGTPGYMNWNQIKELKANGNDIVSHSVNHPDLSKSKAANIAYELVESKKVLDQNLQQNTQTIVYPSGKYNENVMNLAQQSGYLIGRTTAYGTLVSPSNIMELPTRRIYNSTNFITTVTTNPQIAATPAIKKSTPIGTIKCPEYSNSNIVKINLSATDDVNPSESLQMQIANNSNFSNSSYEKFNTSKDINLDNIDGVKTVYVRYKNPNGAVSSTYSCTITLDMHAPFVSDININSKEKSIDISWSTSKKTSSKINYGINSDMGNKVENSEMSLTHTVTINNLIPCINYHFNIESKDISNNSSKSEDIIASTKGCIASSEITLKTGKDIYPSNGGTVELKDDQKKISVNIPPNALSTNENIQINKVVKENVLSTLGKPSDDSEVIGDEIYELNAVANISEVQTQFKIPLEIKIAYSKNDVKDIDLSTLKIYRYDDKLHELSECVNDLAASTVTCKTNHFSTFALFGKSTQISSEIISGLKNNTLYYITVGILTTAGFAYSFIINKKIYKMKPFWRK